MPASMPSRFIQITIYILAFMHQWLVRGDGTVTITDAPAFTQQRPCATICFEYIYVNYHGFPLAGALGCSLNPVENDCFCRTDLEGHATQYLKSCVSDGCSNNFNDIQTAQSIYLAYCSSNGYSAGTRATSLNPTQGNTISGNTGGTGTSNSGGSGNNGNGNSGCSGNISGNNNCDNRSGALSSGDSVV